MSEVKKVALDAEKYVVDDQGVKYHHTSPSVSFVVSLSATTTVFLAAILVNGLAAIPQADRYGFKNSTANVSFEFYTQSPQQDGPSLSGVLFIPGSFFGLDMHGLLFPSLLLLLFHFPLCLWDCSLESTFSI